MTRAGQPQENVFPIKTARPSVYSEFQRRRARMGGTVTRTVAPAGVYRPLTNPQQIYRGILGGQ